jgi:hypothetical protein
LRYRTYAFRFYLHIHSRLGDSLGKLTCQRKQNNPIHNKHRPEDGDIEDLEPGAEEGNHNGASRIMPELELRQAANEGAELVVLARGQGRRAAVQAVVSVRRSNRRVEFR